MEKLELIARWIKEENLCPDYDGYLGCQTIPEDVMKKYIELYPNDWNNNAGIINYIFPINLIVDLFKWVKGLIKHEAKRGDK